MYLSMQVLIDQISVSIFLFQIICMIGYKLQGRLLSLIMLFVLCVVYVMLVNRQRILLCLTNLLLRMQGYKFINYIMSIVLRGLLYIKEKGDEGINQNLL